MLPRILHSTFQVPHLSKSSMPQTSNIFSLPILSTPLLRVRVHSNGLQLPPLVHSHPYSKLSSMELPSEEVLPSNSVLSSQTLPLPQRLTLKFSTDTLITMMILTFNLPLTVLLMPQRPISFKLRTPNLFSTKSNTISSPTKPETSPLVPETSHYSMAVY